MEAFDYGSLGRTSLMSRLAQERPQNDSPAEGFALVSVQCAADFADGHIPHSINIPRGREHQIERRFARTKEIVIYGDGFASWAAASVAITLLHRGFVSVSVYEGGLFDWRAADGAVHRVANPIRPEVPAKRRAAGTR
jgi:3-mercaptopyruvate sulfurtransferase SseA